MVRYTALTHPTNFALVVRQVKTKRPIRDALVTQQAILDAAEAEFSRHGLNGARIGAIARGAGVTTAMIHYYFQNKEGLYKAVLQRPVLEAQEVMAKLNLKQLAPKQALEAFVRAAIAYEAAHPQRGMLWFQEANQNQGEYFKLSQSHWSNTFAYIFDILNRGMADGSFRTLNPNFAIVQIMGVCIFYFNIHENWKHLTPNIDRLSPEIIEQYANCAVEMILRAVAVNS
jgi:TetR/AcrR family transcriptional regulator